MTMWVRRTDVPGHEAEVTEYGWKCSCGAGKSFNEPHARGRVAGGARRHITIAARDMTPADDVPEAIDETGMTVPNDAADVRAAREAELQRTRAAAEKNAERWAEQERPRAASGVDQFRGDRAQ